MGNKNECKHLHWEYDPIKRRVKCRGCGYTLSLIEYNHRIREDKDNGEYGGGWAD